MSKYRELLAQKEKLEAQIRQAREVESTKMLGEIRAVVLDFGFTARDIFGEKGSGNAGSKRPPVPPKYRDPKSGATWSGRGRAPSWIAGKDRAKFAI
ncbi:H-NS histone family protein [Paraburkholderia adhaesiva]|uniref:H-NS histone family protein n=1 Tax=Paraburkholderia adhaesiva TaxID=2883244 RepID=UPI001F292525|nr:H-NS histone family protein [Paraburkholderia adhaesiva]